MQDYDTRYNQASGGGFVSGLLFGAAVGAALGVIFAPRAGTDTRRQIAESGKNLREGAMRTYEQAREGATGEGARAAARRAGGGRGPRGGGGAPPRRPRGRRPRARPARPPTPRSAPPATGARSGGRGGGGVSVVYNGRGSGVYLRDFL